MACGTLQASGAHTRKPTPSPKHTHRLGIRVSAGLGTRAGYGAGDGAKEARALRLVGPQADGPPKRQHA